MQLNTILGKASYGSPSKYLSLDFLKEVKAARYCSHDSKGNLKEYCAAEVDKLINAKSNINGEKEAKELIEQEAFLREVEILNDDFFGEDATTPDCEKNNPAMVQEQNNEREKKPMEKQTQQEKELKREYVHTVKALKGDAKEAAIFGQPVKPIISFETFKELKAKGFYGWTPYVDRSADYAREQAACKAVLADLDAVFANYKILSDGWFKEIRAQKKRGKK